MISSARGVGVVEGSTALSIFAIASPPPAPSDPLSKGYGLPGAIVSVQLVVRRVVLQGDLPGESGGRAGRSAGACWNVDKPVCGARRERRFLPDDPTACRGDAAVAIRAVVDGEVDLLDRHDVEVVGSVAAD